MKRVQLACVPRRTLFQAGRAAALCIALAGPAVALAQSDAPKPDVSMQPMDHSTMDHGNMKGMDHGDMKTPSSGTAEGMNHDGMQGMKMDMNSMQGGTAPPDARDPDAYADGLTLGHTPGMDMADNNPYGQLLLNHFEGYKAKGGQTGVVFDAQAWFGGDLNKVWLKAEGERSNGTLGPTRTVVLYNRAIATYWGLQAGLRHDFGGGPSRNWAAFGVQGLAPYWFDIEATAYVGSSGRTALRLEADYDLRITQRLVLKPDLGIQFYGKNDAERGIGSGLSDIDLGLRLRYEITRKFAPYVGVDWGRKFGNTADLARRGGSDVSETRFVVGIRMWF